jgi:phospholipid/cholesterol/gamma-HCH transport system ATP-binding protein
MNGQDAPQPACITVRDLDIAYGSFVVQRNLNFTVNRQDVFIIMGASGCGKSSLLRVLAGLHAPLSGSILYNGRDFWQAPERERLDMLKRMGMLFQSGALWSSMTLAENVALPLERHTRLTSAQIREQAVFKLSLVGLAGCADLYPAQISGGMRKRAGLARALAFDPEIVFFDEPSAGLDPVSAAMLDELILQLKENLGMTIVIVTHELASIFAIGGNSIFLDVEQRTITARGNPRALRQDWSNPVVARFLNRAKTTAGKQ